MMMTDAFGTSTPTSTTDVATRTCVCPSANALSAAAFSSEFICPCRMPNVIPGNFSTSALCSTSALLNRSNESAVDALTSGVMT